MHQIQPAIGQWYLRSQTGRKFEVIDIDDGDGLIEIQDEEGTLDQIDSDTWFSDALETTEQPQNFTGALDNISEPDEADGGDAVILNAPDADPLRVAQEEMLNDADSTLSSNSSYSFGEEDEEEANEDSAYNEQDDDLDEGEDQRGSV